MKSITPFFLAAACAISCTASEPDRSIIPLPEPAFEGRSGELGKGGTGTLFINDKKIGEARIGKTVPGRFGIDTFGVGMDTGSPVSNTYKPPFAFTGTIHEVRIELK